MNKKAAGDISNLYFAILIFIVVLSGSIAIAYIFFNENNVTIPKELSSLDSLSGVNSNTSTYLRTISGSLKINDTSQSSWVTRLEDSMLGKGFSTITSILDLPNKLSAMLDQLQQVLAIPSWLFYPLLTAIFGLFVMLIIYFIRGLVR